MVPFPLRPMPSASDQAVHGIGRIHAGAGAAGRGRPFLQIPAVPPWTWFLRQRFPPLQTWRKGLFYVRTHVPPAWGRRKQNGRDIDSCGSHQKARERSCRSWGSLPGRQNHGPWPYIPCCHRSGSLVTREYFMPTCPMAMPSHTAMAGNTMGCRRPWQRPFYRFHNFIQVHMARNDFIIGAEQYR